MSTPHNPPGPNPRQAKGFLVTVALPTMVPASRLRPHDVFALPEQGDLPFTVAGIASHPDFAARLVISLRGASTAITLHADELVRPILMPRTVEMICQLCSAAAVTDIDLVAHGEPKTWVCSRH